jgi:hypothetical protein
MSTDDRDIESSNPSKNFKVGDFDQGSGFFTPVWESKRRIRSEPPAPPSSGGNSSRPAPSSKSPAPRGSEPPPAGAAPSEPATDQRSDGRAKAAPVPRPRAAAAAGTSRPRSSPARAATPLPSAPTSDRASANAEPHVLLPPAVAAVFNAPTRAKEPSALADREPSGHAAEREPEAKAVTPSAAARALRDAGPDLPPAAFLDEEPDFRSPRPAVPRPARADRSPLQYRSLRATSAATRVHEQLKAKLQAEAAEIDESRCDLEPETHPNPLRALESDQDPYPLSLMRRLRRTIRLSAPVPDPVRSLISKYDRG